MNDDERLKATFDKLRADDARRAPSFEKVRGRRRARVSPWAVVLPAVSTLAAAAALFVVRCEPAPPPVRAKVDDAPLDFLLEIPGLHGIPNFDTSSLRGSLR